MSTKEASPFLKYLGGKRGILHHLLERVPKSYSTYYEPFVGGGALFFAVKPKKYYIGDRNHEVINCYEVIKKDVDDLIETLSEMFPYKVGDQEFNKQFYSYIRSFDRLKSFNNHNDIFKAARTIYLNKTCYNGLYRVNSKNQFNVPFGNYTNPKILDKNNLLLCSNLLNESVGVVECSDFENILSFVKKDDFVYLDPPYFPTSETSKFTSYTPLGFNLEQHIRLANMCSTLNEMGVKFMLSNSNTSTTIGLYKGYNLAIVSANRSVNRGRSTDIIVTNY